MTMSLRFDDTQYEVKTLELKGRSITYRAFCGIPYCTNPLDPIQKLNLFVPEAYYHGGTINGYDRKSAPIYMPNTVGGYMPGPAMEPGIDKFNGNPNTAFAALEHGYIAACAGIRGRTTGEESNEFFVGSDASESTPVTGKRVGRAPALIVDMKAAIRYLRHNRDIIPGNTEHIITNGTSAGGALSALTGASGNSPDYEPWLRAIGAAEERDDIFGASVYCPIHNLEHADMAYEWQFLGINDYHRINFVNGPDGVQMIPESGQMEEDAIDLSQELAARFPAYLNSLHLKDAEGNELTLNENGLGTFKDYLSGLILQSAQKELDTHWSRDQKGLVVEGSDVEKQTFLGITDNRVTGLDFSGYVRAITRMKCCPAFDSLDLNSPECEEFGDENVYARHFTESSMKHSKVAAEMADPEIIRIMNPVNFVGTAGTAPHWRIRHGAYDRDTSIAIPTILALLLANNGFDVDYFLPWGLPHSGDYDLEEQFRWIDRICNS